MQFIFIKFNKNFLINKIPFFPQDFDTLNIASKELLKALEMSHTHGVLLHRCPTQPTITKQKYLEQVLFKKKEMSASTHMVHIMLCCSTQEGKTASTHVVHILCCSIQEGKTASTHVVHILCCSIQEGKTASTHVDHIMLCCSIQKS